MKTSDIYRKLRGNVLHHYTHSDNISGIKKRDKTILSHSNLDLENIEPTYITDVSSRIMDKRLRYNNYVFLVFTSQHPFIYKQKQNDIPIERIDIDVSILDLQDVLIADRIATDSEVVFYSPEEALENLKIEYSKDKFISDKNIWDEIIKYEILIPNCIDLKTFLI